MLRLLVPVNGSEHALDAVRYAAHLFLDRCVSDIVLLNVQGPIEHGRAIAFHSVSALREIGRKQAEAALRKARGILDDAGAHYVTQIEVGPVARTIAQCAAANQCDAIVMGTAGRSLIGTLVAGRLSNRLIRMSAVPVTLVK
ncbi:universal stress protein [Cupriavidus oxalaticus]|uniref:Universal stress protein n=1 Tax=Cupriavidus oxalaticus TaxID=96344 RepID=A0A375FRP3_9BURK|nr:universal stress protein [Cupriavidus oxalaticus]QRQ85918.1 universal stress protein [Cupriavidus oxalaticus]QRQ95756.1 universal stress protein [Cupriavidus oxalaticus]WQD84422.1 universal stress protein [Cupriavidus oxalaticus]SPC06682.1 Universal stress protein (Usp) [Cupriavidus oxalaticus]